MRYFVRMMQENLIMSVASRRSRDIERERPGVKAEIEDVPELGRAIIHISRDGRPSGVEFVESEASLKHPAVDKDYMRYLRDGLYLGIVVPRQAHRLEEDLITRLKVLRERVRDEGFPTTHGPALYVYDYDGNVEGKGLGKLE